MEITTQLRALCVRARAAQPCTDMMQHGMAPLPTTMVRRPVVRTVCAGRRECACSLPPLVVRGRTLPRLRVHWLRRPLSTSNLM
jgi:hypothetical protein